jgi:hypothetical protein
VNAEEAKALEKEVDPESDDPEDLIIDGPRKRRKVNYASVSHHHEQC